MKYEYDDRKSRQTLLDRGIDFDFAIRVFDDEFIEYEDTRRDYGEPRYVAIGSVEGTLFAVVYTWRNDRRRSSLQDEPTGENGMPTVERSRKRLTRTGRVEWSRVHATTDEDIARQIAEDADTAPELGEEDLDRAVIVSPDGTRISYRERAPSETDLLEAGQEAPQSGQYEITGPRGRKTGEERTLMRGEPMPPTPKVGQRYRLKRKA